MPLGERARAVMAPMASWCLKPPGMRLQSEREMVTISENGLGSELRERG